MGDFEIEDVLYFIISKGCRVRNHELVTHFRNFLNHPVDKVHNRDKFKNFVNELATVKIEGGDKILVLKKKHRPPSDNHDSTSMAPPLFPPTQFGSKSAGGGRKTVRSEPDLSAAQSSSSVAATPAADIDDRLAHNDSLRAHSEPPNGATGTSETGLDNPDGVSMSKVKSDESVEVTLRHSDRLPIPPGTVEDSVNVRSINGSNSSLASADGSQKSLASNTSGVASMDEDVNASVVSVQDKIKKLNKNISESDVNQPKSTNSSSGGNKKINKNTGGDDDDTSHSSGSFVALDDEQREWMVVCSHADYHDMNRLLSKNPALAKIKDFTNGYTALHWAAKSGKSEVIKLVANKPGVNVDQRSHGGYTALHLAAIHGQEEIIELLVQTYKADPNLRDYSGKKAKQYLKNSASSKAQQLLVSRRLGSDQSHIKILDDSFIRSASMRMSNRAKAMSSLLQFRSSVARQPILRSSWNGTSDEIYNDKERNLKTPPNSAGSSPGSSRKKSSNDAYLMPPPSDTGTRRTYQSSRMKSSSRDASPSSRHKNGDSLNMIRSGSDPGLLEKTSTSTIV